MGRIEKRSEAVALLERVALIQIRKSKLWRESGHVADRLIAKLKFVLVLCKAHIVKVRVCRGMISNLVTCGAPRPYQFISSCIGVGSSHEQNGLEVGFRQLGENGLIALGGSKSGVVGHVGSVVESQRDALADGDRREQQGRERHACEDRMAEVLGDRGWHWRMLRSQTE